VSDTDFPLTPTLPANDAVAAALTGEVAPPAMVESAVSVTVIGPSVQTDQITPP
jgi:hypothetical protein